MLEETSSVLGQLHAPRPAVEQADTELCLERRDLSRDGGLGVGEPTGRAADRALLGDFAKTSSSRVSMRIQNAKCMKSAWRAYDRNLEFRRDEPRSKTGVSTGCRGRTRLG
jgi:hypothetical protein